MVGPIERIVIVGAGQAGGWCARALRDEGYAESIILVGDEAHPPYERPPLSKDVLLGRAAAASTYLFRGDAWKQLAVDFRRGRGAIRIDRQGHTVELSDGEVIAFDRLVLATGGRPAPLPVPGGDKALLLRSIADADLLRSRMGEAHRMAVVGGGWIGLEVAAAARSMGLQVAVLEATDRLCGRAAPSVLSDYLEQLHRQHRVEVRLGVRVAAVDEKCVRLAGGEQIDADLVVAGIGLVANDHLAAAAGLEVERGIVTDPCGRTADPAIFACGDVSVFEHPTLRRRVRLESWANAQNQAIACARALLGRQAENNEAPWFWSDQHGVNIQLVGLPGADGEIVVRGTPAAGKGSWHAMVGDQLVGTIAVNAGRDIKVAKRLIEKQLAVERTAIADTKIDLRRLLPAMSS
ncbi:MAG: FAD-dependent oxidoreductase [Rhodospirillales bacterium]|nr:FAD-dependent oxidoreductase [Rhodospirillales bacterium]